MLLVNCAYTANFYLKVYNKANGNVCPTIRGNDPVSKDFRKSRRFMGVMISKFDCKEKTIPCPWSFQSPSNMLFTRQEHAPYSPRSLYPKLTNQTMVDNL